MMYCWNGRQHKVYIIQETGTMTSCLRDWHAATMTFHSANPAASVTRSSPLLRDQCMQINPSAVAPTTIACVCT